MLEKQKREFQSLEKQPLKTKAPKKNKENVECHHCGSTKYRRKGFDKGRPMYYCKDCSRHFILGANVLSNKDCIQLELACPECGNAQCWKAGKARDGRQRYKCKNCHRTFTKEPKQGKYDHNLPLSDDVWLASSLGVTVPEHRSLTKLVFIYIRQDWLKAIAKRFVRYMSKNRTFQTLTSYISELNCFSEFLDERYPSVNFNNINRYVIVDFIEYLNQKLTSSGAKSHYLSTLNVFFDVGTMNKWFDLPAGLILKEDFPKHRKPLPRYMPEEVIQKLNQHLDELPKPVMRMVLVIQECGLRVSELLHLPINCLRKSQKGDWYIQFMRGKTKKETTLPVSQQLAAVVGEQQEYIQDAFGKGNFDYLFCAKRQEPPGYHHRFRPQPKMMRDDSFTSYLKDLAEKFDICDSSGKRWNFQSHQFRHTVGTQMINNGVPQHIVQRYLGHESPEMTMVYAHIHDETLAQHKKPESQHSVWRKPLKE